MGSGQGPLEVGDGFALAMIQTAFNLVDQDVAAPAMLDGLTGVPKTLGRILHGLDQANIVAPRQSCNNLLHDLPIGIGLGERPHVFEVSPREASHLRECPPQIFAEPVDYASAPAFCRLPVKDVTADAPVEKDQLLVDCDSGPKAGGTDSLLQLTQKCCVSVEFRRGRYTHHGMTLAEGGENRCSRKLLLFSLRSKLISNEITFRITSVLTRSP